MLKLSALSLFVVSSLFLSSTLYAENKSIIKEQTTSPVLTAPTSLPSPPLPSETSHWEWGNPESIKKSFNNMDKNYDGKISVNETIDYQKIQKEQRKKEEFDQILKNCDKNNDGTISKDEFSPEKNFFDVMGGATPVEGTNSPEELFKNSCMLPPFAMDIMDFNEDGILTTDEVKRAVMSDKPPTKKAKEKLEKKMNSVEVNRKSKQFKKCDKNQDEILSLREAVSSKCSIIMFTEEFDAHDSNGDRYLSTEEIGKKIKPVMRESDLPPLEALNGMPPLVRLEMVMHECDKDQNEQLERSETITARCEVDPSLFEKIDHNQNGSIEQDEMQRMHQKENFDRNDKNKDGFIDKAEFKPDLVW